MGTNGCPPGAAVTDESRSWVGQVQSAVDDRAISFDFTTNGSTIAEAQRDQLPAAVAANADLVSLFIGPDDFRDATDHASFERRFSNVLEALVSNGSTVFVVTLPDLRSLPTLAEEDDQVALHSDLAAWNRSIVTISGEHRAHVVRLDSEEVATPDGLFTESADRFILTVAGQDWVASKMAAPLLERIGTTNVPGNHEEPADE
jgi:hypothetical protein